MQSRSWYRGGGGGEYQVGLQDRSEDTKERKETDTTRRREKRKGRFVCYTQIMSQTRPRTESEKDDRPLLSETQGRMRMSMRTENIFAAKILQLPKTKGQAGCLLPGTIDHAPLSAAARKGRWKDGTQAIRALYLSPPLPFAGKGLRCCI